MASSSNPPDNVGDRDQEIEHYNRTLPLTAEEIEELVSQPSPADQFKEVQEHLLELEASNQKVRGKLQTKKVTLRSAVVIPDDERSHRSGKEPMEQEQRAKKSRKHAKDCYERE